MKGVRYNTDMRLLNWFYNILTFLGLRPKRKKILFRKRWLRRKTKIYKSSIRDGLIKKKAPKKKPAQRGGIKSWREVREQQENIIRGR